MAYFQKFAFAKRSGAMKAPVGLLSDRTVLRSKMEGPRPDKFAFAQRSGAMKAPVGLLSDRTVLRSKIEGPCPDKFTLTRLDFCGNLSSPISATARCRNCAPMTSKSSMLRPHTEQAPAGADREDRSKLLFSRPDPSSTPAPAK